MGLSVEHPPIIVNGTNDPARVLSGLRQLRLGWVCIPALADRGGSPLMFLVRVESLVRAVQMMGPSRSAGVGRDALPRVRRRAFIGREQLGEKKTRASERGLQRLADAQRRSRGSATLPGHSRSNASLVARTSASLIFKPGGLLRPKCSLYDPRSGPSARLLYVTNAYFEE